MHPRVIRAVVSLIGSAVLSSALFVGAPSPAHAAGPASTELAQITQERRALREEAKRLRAAQKEKKAAERLAKARAGLEKDRAVVAKLRGG